MSFTVIGDNVTGISGPMFTNARFDRSVIAGPYLPLTYTQVGHSLALGRVIVTSAARAITASKGNLSAYPIGRVIVTAIAYPIRASLHTPLDIGHVVSSRIGHRLPDSAGHVEGIRPGHIEP